MKILFFNTFYYPDNKGGAEISVQELAEGMIGRGHEVTVVSIAGDGIGKTRNVNGVTCIYLHLSKSFYLQNEGFFQKPMRFLRNLLEIFNPFILHKLYITIKKENPDCISAHNIKGFSVALWCAAFLTGKRIQQMAHDYYLVCGNSSMYRHGILCKSQCLKCKIVRFPVRALSFIPCRFISNSMFTEGVLKSCGIIKTNTHCIINPSISIPKETPSANNRPVDTKLVIGYLGRIDESKGLDVLLKAIKLITSDAVVLQVAGNGVDSYVESLKINYADNRIKFLGRVKPEEFLPTIHFLVGPSVWHEPFGRVIIEAYSYGIPVIASDVGGMTELVSPETGFLFKAGDINQLACIIQKLIREKSRSTLSSDKCREKSLHYDKRNAILAFDKYLPK